MGPATSRTISVHVRLLARYAELAGRDGLTVEVPAPASVADVVAAARGVLPDAHWLPARPLCALNHAHALPGQPVGDGDEVALLPPVAGG